MTHKHKDTRSLLGALLAYGALAVVVTSPLLRSLGTALPGISADQWVYLWFLDTFWTQALAGKSPLTTDRVLFPIGTNLMHATSAPFVSLLALPFRADFIAYLGLVVLASLVAAALGMFVLVRALTRDDGAAAVAGLLYGFSPALLSKVENSHYYVVAAAAMLPFGLLALITFVRTPRPRALVALSAVTWALVFTDYYVAILFLVMVVTLAAACLGRCTRRHLVLVAVAATANGLIALAATRWLLPSLDTSDFAGGGDAFWSTSTVNLADLVVPRRRNPVLGGLADWATDRLSSDIDCFLGWGILALAAAGLWRRRRDPVIAGLAAAGGLSLALACGTAVRWRHAVLVTGARTPWYWFVRLPTLVNLDSPRRFVIGTVLAVAVLAGVALARRQRRGLVLGGALVLFALEFGQLGMPLTTFPVPAVYRRLAAAADGRTLLELPSGITESKGGFGLELSPIRQNSEQMYWQTVHRHPRVCAYLSRIPRTTYRWFEAEPVIGDLLTMTSTSGWNGRTLQTLPAYPPEVVTQFLRRFNLGHVLLVPSGRQAQLAREVERLLAGRIARRDIDDGGYVLYTLGPE